MKRLSKKFAPVLVLAVLGLALSLTPGCGVGYVLQQGYFQAELLLSRQPIEQAIASGHFSDQQVEKLRKIAVIKEFGRSIGLAATDNYETVTPTWERTIYNVSGCDPVAFRPVRWWFPVVGSMPYLGFFREGDARKQARKLSLDGKDVYVRTAGAYSTLGWFKDPILPGMLAWSEASLADTVLHELAHATLWVPGSVQFNESFANFVGEEAALLYLVDVYGAESTEVADRRARTADRLRYRKMLHDVYGELDAMFREEHLTRADKILRKQAIFATIPSRVALLDLENRERWVRYTQRDTWNNARMMQFRTYNRSRDWFKGLHDAVGGDLLAFIDRIREVTKGQKDPYKALAEAVGVDPKADP